MRKIVLIVHNVRSCHNVGSLLRTADGLGIEAVYLTGYTPYPVKSGDSRLPHLAARIDRQIAKTALGAEKSVKWFYSEDIEPVLKKLKEAGYQIGALEQAEKSIHLADFRPPDKVALLVGSEVNGIEPEILDQTSVILEIPMLGSKESFNVTNAAAMALYHLRFT